MGNTKTTEGMMVKKVTKLTPEQIALFGEWSERWINIGLSTEPADFDKATAAALKAYELCNLKRPMVVLRMGSPYAATFGGALAWMYLREIEKVAKIPKVGAQVGDQVGDQVWAQVWDQVSDQVGDQVGDQVWAQVWDQVRDQVGDQVGDQVWAQVRAQVWAQVRAQVWVQVRDQVGDQVGDQVRAQVRDQGFVAAKDGLNNDGASGLLWSSFAAWVSYFRDVCGWENPALEKFTVAEDMVKSCGWTWWHQNVLAISDRPKKINRDAEKRLHCETGPSIEYRDGWSLWHWHGVSVPRGWIEDKASLTAKTALTWENIEQRRAACEILGWAKVLSELNATVIDTDPEPHVGQLLEVELPDIGRERFLSVTCGTGRHFALPVPSSMKTALEANCWTYGIDADRSMIPETRT
jgi:hypothetical protein